MHILRTIEFLAMEILVSLGIEALVSMGIYALVSPVIETPSQ